MRRRRDPEPSPASPVLCSTAPHPSRAAPVRGRMETPMNGLIYLVGLIVVILAILSFFGLR
jgi:hypothetical protein